MIKSKSIDIDVSIIIVSWNRKTDVDLTLGILLKMSGDYKSEIIVTDNGSTDGTCQLIREKYPSTKLIELGKNTGIKAYNIGAASASGKYLIFLDDDSHLEKNAVGKVISQLDANPEVGVIGFKIILPENNKVVNGDWKRYITSFWGCGFAVRKQIVNEIGLYDENLFLYTNEYDLAIRVWNHGFKVVFNPEIIAYHRVSSMNRASGRLVYLSTRNDIWFNLRYFPFPYILYTLPVNLIDWFLRALLERTVKFFFQGLFEGFSTCRKIKKKAVTNETIFFYLRNHRNFEFPLIKIVRKWKNRTLFKIVNNV